MWCTPSSLSVSRPYEIVTVVEATSVQFELGTPFLVGAQPTPVNTVIVAEPLKLPVWLPWQVPEPPTFVKVTWPLLASSLPEMNCFWPGGSLLPLAVVQTKAACITTMPLALVTLPSPVTLPEHESVAVPAPEHDVSCHVTSAKAGEAVMPTTAITPRQISIRIRRIPHLPRHGMNTHRLHPREGRRFRHSLGVSWATK